MAETTKLSSLKINVMTQEQYNSAEIDENQIYLITDNAEEYLPIEGGTLTGDLILASNPTVDMGAATKNYVDTKTSGLASTSSVDTSISTHNTSTSAHNDIRGLISDLTTKLNNFLDVDDTTTDQLSEVLTLIANNKGTLESLTTSKINVADIVNNLTTNNSSKVLSAAQGVAIKNLIDALQSEVNGKSDEGHGHSISDITDLQTTLNAKVPTTRTVNGKALSSNITLSASDVGADASGSASSALSSAQTYTDNAVAQKTQVQIIIWGAND